MLSIGPRIRVTTHALVVLVPPGGGSCVETDAERKGAKEDGTDAVRLHRAWSVSGWQKGERATHKTELRLKTVW